ncbi:outer membrane protein assembly factor BamB family protein [Nonomuraea maritima]|uniref:outer membrane protein assembly factor BamB family protein n=1 Tax=Nonomuraea maritima TaxID=683260 RepID=UPI0037126F80
MTTRWERPLHQRPSAGAPAIGEDCVVVHERHTRLVCLDRRYGTPRWDVPVGTWPRAVVIAGDRCLCLSQEGVLSCIDLATGAVVWRACLPEFSG